MQWANSNGDPLTYFFSNDERCFQNIEDDELEELFMEIFKEPSKTNQSFRSQFIEKFKDKFGEKV